MLTQSYVPDEKEADKRLFSLVAQQNLRYDACTFIIPMDATAKKTTLRRKKDRTDTPMQSPARTSARARSRHGLRLLEDISSLISRSHNMQETLEGITETITERIGTEVCSLYLFDPKNERLTLWATTGLDRSAVGKVSMGINEGLTGLVIQQMEPVAVEDTMLHKRNLYFPETGEERFHSFLGLPIVERRNPIGVLVVQSRDRRHFSRAEIRLLKTIASHLIGIIGQARLLETLEATQREREEYHKRLLAAIKRLSMYERERVEKTDAKKGRPGRTRLGGVGASPGFGIGQAHIVHPRIHLEALTERRTTAPEAELRHLHEAIAAAVQDIEQLKARVHERLPEIDCAIFDAHCLMLQDETFLEKIATFIQQGYAAETALKKVIEEYVDALNRTGSELMRERTADIRDIGQRVLYHLLGLEEHESPRGENLILVAEELTLSDLCLVDHTQLKGAVMARGGATSHASILAKSFEIPTVVGTEHVDFIQPGNTLIVDGNSGVVYVNPSTDVVRDYKRQDREYRAFNRELEDIHDLPAITRDGMRVSLCANVGLLIDLTFAQRHGAEGIGLYRTEIPFLTYHDFPGEEEQLDLYRRVLIGMNGKPVTIRTLDLGPDKYPAYLRLPREDNPFLGWRSIRISLEMADLFKVQLRAILRAGTYGPVRILFPMISSVEEITQIKALLAEVKEELRQEGKPFDPWIPIGIMVEVPAAVWLADRLVQQVDFFSIGTNDLIQYLLAVDRNNRKVASLYEPLHPAVLIAVYQTVQTALRAGKRVSMCGEMAADPLCTLVLLGMGLEELSMEPFFVPVIKRVVRLLSYTNARQLTQEVLRMETAQQVKGRLFEELKQREAIQLVEMYR